jgi:hypothetical protein
VHAGADRPGSCSADHVVERILLSMIIIIVSQPYDLLDFSWALAVISSASGGASD